MQVLDWLSVLRRHRGGGNFLLLVARDNHPVITRWASSCAINASTAGRYREPCAVILRSTVGSSAAKLIVILPLRISSAVFSDPLNAILNPSRQSRALRNVRI